MRAAGHGFQSIADTLGYSDASGASKAYHRALQRRPAQNVDEIRAQEAERLEYCWRETAKVIDCPPPVHSAIGKVVFIPGTEVYETDASGSYTHDKAGKRIIIDGQMVRDERAKIAAISEYRKLSESFRKMTGADLARPAADPAQDAMMTEAFSWLDTIRADNERLTRDNAILRSELASLRDELSAVPAELV